MPLTFLLFFEFIPRKVAPPSSVNFGGMHHSLVPLLPIIGGEKPNFSLTFILEGDRPFD